MDRPSDPPEATQDPAAGPHPEPPAPGPELFPLLLEIGGHPALDLVNTRVARPGGRRELLREPADLAAWLALARPELPPLPPELAQGPAGRALLDGVLTLRDHIETAVESLAAGGDLPPATLSHLNALLAASPPLEQLQGGARTYSRVLRRPTDTHSGLLGHLAAEGAELFTRTDLDRLRRCGSERCILWFLDQSRSGSRRWCSMRTCGNRAKGAAHRARRNPGAERNPA